MTDVGEVIGTLAVLAEEHAHTLIGARRFRAHRGVHLIVVADDANERQLAIGAELGAKGTADAQEVHRHVAEADRRRKVEAVEDHVRDVGKREIRDGPCEARRASCRHDRPDDRQLHRKHDGEPRRGDRAGDVVRSVEERPRRHQRCTLDDDVGTAVGQYGLDFGLSGAVGEHEPCRHVRRRAHHADRLFARSGRHSGEHELADSARRGKTDHDPRTHVAWADDEDSHQTASVIGFVFAVEPTEVV